MNNLMYFVRYLDVGEEKMALMETLENGIPVNVRLEEGSDLNLNKGTLCEVDLSAKICNLRYYDNEELLTRAATGSSPYTMISMNPDDSSFPQVNCIRFTGRVSAFQFKKKLVYPDDPNLRFFVQSHELDFWLYVHFPSDFQEFNDKGPEVTSHDNHPVHLHKGMILEGTARLYGTVKTAET